MKKWTMILFAFVAYFLFLTPVYAASAGISVSNSSVYVGDGFTVYANVTSTAAWNVHVNASGPVSGCTINEVGDSGDLNEVNRNFSATCTATGEGTISLSLSGDVTNGLGETSGISGNVNVYVSQKPAPSPSPSPSTVVIKPSPSTNPSPSPSPVNGEKKGEEPKSNNNNLKTIKVDGYELTKVDETHYTLNVKNSVDRIVVQVDRADTNAKVTGDGTHTLKIGENKIEIVVTAEDGSKKSYFIQVTRRDTSYKLSQLAEAIRDTTSGPVEIVLEKDDVLSPEDLDMMKKAKKTFQLTYYDSEKVGLYTWMFNGGAIDTNKEIDTTIYFTMKDREDFDEAMEFKDGYLLNFSHRGVLPNGTRIRIYVGDKYKNGDSLTLYLYDAETKSRVLYASGVEVVDGYAHVDIEEGGVFFLTKAEFGEKKGFNVFIPICIVEGFIILLLLFLRKKSKDKEENVEVLEEKKEEVPVTAPETVPSTVPSSIPAPVTNPAPAVAVVTTPAQTEVVVQEPTPATTVPVAEVASAPQTVPAPVMASAPETLPAPAGDIPAMPVVDAPPSVPQAAPETTPVLVATPIATSQKFAMEPRVY